MNVANHTPGPWQCYADLPSSDPNWHVVTNESRMRVIANIHIEPGNVTDAANARLIAASPDLLDGCNALLGLIQLVLSRDDLTADLREALSTSHRVAEANAAIAKAVS